MSRGLLITFLTVVLLAVDGVGVRASPAMPDLVAYGHSWVSGHGVQRAYPQRVGDRLGLPVRNRANPGDLAAATATRIKLHPPGKGDVVVVEEGLNDARAYGRVGIEVFRENLTATLNAAAKADLVILVLEQPIPGWRAYTPFNLGSPAVIRAYRKATRAVAADRTDVVTVLPSLERVDFQADGVHPDPSGHRKIASAVVKAARRNMA